MATTTPTGAQPATGLLALEPAWVALNVTAAQLKVLYLAVAYGEVDGRYIQLRLNMLPSTLTRIADRLVESGLVTRQSYASDRRVVCYQPTEAGKSLMMGLLPQP